MLVISVSPGEGDSQRRALSAGKAEWVNLAIGLWILASPFALHFPHKSGMHVAVFVAVTVTFVSLLELFLLQDRPAEHRDASAG